MQERKEDRLNQAVEDGVLTEEQRNALAEKHQEMWTERMQEQEQNHEAMDVWFTEQGIDHEALMGYMEGFGKDYGHGEMKHGFGFRQTQ